MSCTAIIYVFAVVVIDAKCNCTHKLNVMHACNRYIDNNINYRLIFLTMHVQAGTILHPPCSYMLVLEATKVQHMQYNIYQWDNTYCEL